MRQDLEGAMIEALRSRPMLFSDLLREFSDYSYREVVKAWVQVRDKFQVERETAEGRYFVPVRRPDAQE